MVENTQVDELLELCRRVLGSEQLARETAAAVAGQPGARARPVRLAAALDACRRLPDPDRGRDADGGAAAGAPLAQAVSAEIARANALLEAPEREALALAELLGLSHAQIARVMGIKRGAVAPLLARARLALHAQLRGRAQLTGACAERAHALALLARRQDAERLSADEEAWLFDHLRSCDLCERSHAAMLEASACYGAWAPGPLD